MESEARVGECREVNEIGWEGGRDGQGRKEKMDMEKRKWIRSSEVNEMGWEGGTARPGKRKAGMETSAS